LGTQRFRGHLTEEVTVNGKSRLLLTILRTLKKMEESSPKKGYVQLSVKERLTRQRNGTGRARNRIEGKIGVGKRKEEVRRKRVEQIEKKGFAIEQWHKTFRYAIGGGITVSAKGQRIGRTKWKRDWIDKQKTLTKRRNLS